MKRIGAVLVVMSMLLACVVPAGASYVWHGESFLDDYYGAASIEEFTVSADSLDARSSALGLTLDGYSSFSHDEYFWSALLGSGSLVPSISSMRPDFSVSSVSSQFLAFSAPVSASISSPTQLGLVYWGWNDPYYPADTAYFDLVFSFSVPVSVLSFSGTLDIYASLDSLDGSVSVSSPVIRCSVISDSSTVSVPVSNGTCDFSGVSVSGSAITSFTLRIQCGSRYVSYSQSSFNGKMSLFFQGHNFGVPSVPYSGGSGDSGDSSADLVVPDYSGSGSSSVIGSISGEEFGSLLSLSPSTSSGGFYVIDYTESYRILVGVDYVDGKLVNKYQTIPASSLPLMKPGSFPNISFSSSGASVSASIPSTAISATSSEHGTITSVENILTGPSGFSGPGSSALWYIDFVVDTTAISPGVSDIELNGSMSVVTSLTVGSTSRTFYGGSFALVVNGAVAQLGTTDMSGNIQFSNFLYASTEPIETVVIRFTPSISSVSVASYRTNASWDIDLDFASLSMSFVTSSGSGSGNGGGGSVDLDKFGEQNNAANDSMGAYDEIESQWSQNMTDNFSALQIDSVTFDAGLLSGFALLTGVFNDIWNIMGIYNVIFVIPLLLGIALLVIGRASRYVSPSGSPSDGGGSDGGLRHRGGTSQYKTWTGKRG